LKKKDVTKLAELIQTGSTSIRVKGKTYRIKTPACKALKRILYKEGTRVRSDSSQVFLNSNPTACRFCCISHSSAEVVERHRNRVTYSAFLRRPRQEIGVA